MKNIQIGLAVHKAIEADRRSLTETEDQILQRLLLGELAACPQMAVTGQSWSKDGVTLPEGTQLRVRYSGQEIQGQVLDGSWLINGRKFNSPSMAMIHNVVTREGRRTNINGWNHWEVKRPYDDEYVKIATLRNA